MNLTRATIVLLMSTGVFSVRLSADEPQPTPPVADSSVQQQLDAQAAEIAELKSQLKELTTLLRQQTAGPPTVPASWQASPAQSPPVAAPLVPPGEDHSAAQLSSVVPMTAPMVGCGDDCSPKIDKQKVPVQAAVPALDSCGEPSGIDSVLLRYVADYDKGFIIRGIDPEADPFRLKVNGWIQARHVGFTRDANFWTDNAGVTRPIRNRNHFDIERARLVFSGNALDKRLSYFLQLDGDADGRDTVDFFDYWWAWTFSDELRVQIGKRKVTAGRQWLRGARNTRLSERPVATDFFRPDRTIGIFATGTINDRFNYEAMVGNGYRTANRNATDLNNDFAVATTGWWDNEGGFGKYLTDHECSEDLKYRVGYSFAYAAQNSVSPVGVPLSESDFVRLADGTRLVQTGALAPGVTVNQFDTYYYAVDLAAKHRGWSINSEVYFRFLQDLGGDGPLPVSQIHQRGFYVEGGRIILPEKLDWNVRFSQVNGDFGSASEYAGGFNWFPLNTRRLKVSFDVTYVDGSPLQNTATEILAGDEGTLFRTQFQAEF
ncbi:MAG: OprO/OprP family phosphate-selective porin [Planctomycetaceae bacterium]|nr:OprO/OprP family phosphate-selective porin [Planctomycetaceae bacterium]